jgi:UPF0755 protein
MNHQATQWLAVADWFRQREQQLRRAGGMRAQIAAPPLPALQDHEAKEFVQTNKQRELSSDICRELEITAVYQAVLADPRAEQAIVEAAGFHKDKAKFDALYQYAKTFTQTIEREAKQELASRTSPSQIRRILQLGALAVLLLLIGAGSWVYMSYSSMKRYLDQPAGMMQKAVTVTVPKGATTAKVAEVLAEQKVILDQNRFYQLARYYRYWKRIFPQLPGSGQMRAGTYIFPTDLTPVQIFSRLRKGPKRRSIRITIPEGFNIFKIAARLERKEICRKEAFLYLARNKAYASRLVGWETPSVEGYLYPDTYKFHKRTKPDVVIRRMVKRFKQLFSDAFRKRMRELNEASNHIVWNVHKVVTLASIIEKETGQKRERPMISSVFHNRIKRKWKLQTDPTVIYGLLPNFDGNITRKHLTTPHPYNTYTMKGLPPGPIASPGVAAIRAALWPTKSRYMYFVSRNDGSHIFSKTLREHNKYVNQYQRKRRRKKRR